MNESCIFVAAFFCVLFILFQVLDYTIQMHRLLPLVAAAFGFHFTGQKLMLRLRRLERDHIHGERISEPGMGTVFTATADDGLEAVREHSTLARKI